MLSVLSATKSGVGPRGTEERPNREPRTSLMEARVWLNGWLVDASEATVSFLTPGLHYGIGVFEGIRCYASPAGPAIFRLAERTGPVTRMLQDVFHEVLAGRHDRSAGWLAPVEEGRKQEVRS